MRGYVPITLAALLVTLVAAAPAQAIPRCQGGEPPKTLAGGQGTLESAIFGKDGRLYFTATPSGEPGRLMVMSKRSGDTPVVLSKPITSPGGLALDERGRIMVGFGNGINGVTGTFFPTSGLFRVNPQSGKRTVFTDGLSMANGVARGPDGTYYASDDFGINIDRIVDGRVEQGWIRTFSPNGLVVSRDGRYLYWAQTFQTPQISRVDLAHPDQPVVFAKGDLSDATAGLDGMVGDARDRLFVAANLAGEVWRVDQLGRACRLASGLDNPSAVAFGSGEHGFGRKSLYVVGFGGHVSEIKGARTAKYPEG